MNRFLLHTVLLTITLLILIGTLVALWYVREQEIGYYTDADTIRTPAQSTSPRDVLWQPPVSLDGRINTDTDEYEPRLTKDGLTMFFVRGKPGENSDILMSSRTSDGWTEPVRIDAINTEAEELGPEPSADGQILYFYSNRDGGLGGYDLWVSSHVDGTWQKPINLGAEVNSGFNDYGPALTPDGEKLYFASNRPQTVDTEIPDLNAWQATVREDLFQRDYDIFVSTLTERGAGPASPVDALNSPFNDGSPAISPVGDYLYFASDRPGGEGGFDIYRSRLLHGEYRELKNLGSTVNSSSNELDPALDMGGFGLHFSSDRSRESTQSNLNYDLYRTTSREVFVENETYRASIEWKSLLPYLLWALLALLLLLLLLLLRKLVISRRFHTLSLLVRCLLLSLAAHIIIMILLGFWGVGSSFSHWLREGGGVQVSIVSPSVGQDLAAQIRGSLTDVMMMPTTQAVLQLELEIPSRLDSNLQEMTDVRQVRFEIERFDQPTTPSTDAPLPDHQVELPDLEAPQMAVHTTFELPEAAVPSVHDEAQSINPQSILPTYVLEMAEIQEIVTEFQTTAVEVSIPQHTAANMDTSLADEYAPADSTPHELAVPSVDAQSLVLPETLVLHQQLAPVPEVPTEQSQETEQIFHALQQQVDRVDTSKTDISATLDTPAGITPLEGQSVDIGSNSIADLIHPITDAPVSLAEVRERAPLTPSEISVPQQFQLSNLPEDVSTATVEQESRITATPESIARQEPVHNVNIANETAQATDATLQVPKSLVNERHFFDAEATGTPDTMMPTSEPVALAVVIPHALDSFTMNLPDTFDPVQMNETDADATNLKLINPKQEIVSQVDLSPTSMSKGNVHLAAVDQATSDDKPLLSRIVTSPHQSMDPLPSLADVTARDTLIIPPLDPIGMNLPTNKDLATRSEETLPSVSAKVMDSACRLIPDGVDLWMESDVSHIEHCDSLQNDLAEPSGVRSFRRNMLYPDPLDREDSVDHFGVTVELLPAANLNVQLPTQVAPPLREVGIVRGTVTDASTNQPLTRAIVRLDLADTNPMIAMTDDQGRYELAVPDIPDFVAISASHEDYDPSSVNVPAKELRRRTVQRDFALTPSRHDVIVIESDPEVHHLGDDSFSGRINSRFQKRSEGRRYRTTFWAMDDQLGSENDIAVIRFLARGTERDNKIRINGHTLRKPLNHAPRDGRFGLFEATFPMSWLNQGSNDLLIQSSWADSAHTDLDDFEFVNIQIHLPIQISQVRNSYPQRRAENREMMLQAYGGSKRTEQAVESALQWLAEHQSDDGRWDSDGYDEDRGASAGHASLDMDIAVTGVSLLCFLSAGHTHVADSPYRQIVQRGLTWLLSQQTPGGSLIGRESLYSHGVATMALAEALAMTDDRSLQQPVAAAIQFIMSARDPELGGWSHAPSQPGNTAVLGWQIMALVSAHNAGINVPTEGFDEATRWLDLVQSAEEPGRYAYKPGTPVSVEISAEAMFVRQLCSDTSDQSEMKATARYILENPPSWEVDANTYYWHFATLALFQHQGNAWQQWNNWIVDELLAHQVTRGAAAGSWPVADEWSQLGGRIYQTAICTLILETYYRYAPLSVHEPGAEELIADSVIIQ